MEVVDFGVDYVTMVRVGLSADPYGTFALVRKLMLDRYWNGLAGVLEEDWRGLGYVGTSFGNMQHGHRADGEIVRVSGYGARYIREINWPMEWKCTRVDLQATVRTPYDIDEGIAKDAGQALGFRRGKQGYPYKVRLIKGYGEGDTLSIGSRSSQKYLRVYNKEKESGTDPAYVGTVRYEAELKGDIADKVFWNWYDERRVDNKVIRLLTSLFAEYGLTVPGGMSQDVDGFWRIAKRETDTESKLNWLRIQVAPTVRQLTREGLISDVMAALGLEYGE